jgi:hypothetical protein
MSCLPSPFISMRETVCFDGTCSQTKEKERERHGANRDDCSTDQLFKLLLSIANWKESSSLFISSKSNGRKLEEESSNETGVCSSALSQSESN